MTIKDICADVRLFLDGLTRELPGVFPPPRLYRRPALRRRRPNAAENAARAAAGELIRGRVGHWAARLGLECNRVFIKDQRTLWGSCSGRRNLNFNWRLAAAPPEALDYVVIHELCHLREMNHSRRFWALVKDACPDYAARRKWLRENGAALKQAIPDNA